MSLMRQATLRRLSFFTMWFTFLLILAGGMVTSTGSGLSIPTWPLAYGKFIPIFSGGMIYEYTHRVIAALDIILILGVVLATSLWESRRWVKTTAFAMLGLLLTQAMIGALTVWYLLPPWLSFSHGVVSQTVFLLTVVLAYAQSREFAYRKLHEHDRDAVAPLVPTAIFLSALVYIQLILGSLIRHMRIYISDYPTIYFLHRMNALIAFMVVVVINFFIWKRKNVPRTIKTTLLFIDVLIVSQVTLGAFVTLPREQPILTTVHVMLGAAILGLSALLFLRSAAWEN